MSCPVILNKKNNAIASSKCAFRIISDIIISKNGLYTIILHNKMSLIPKLLRFAVLSINSFRIDESHGIFHSMNVLHHSHNILQSELPRNPFLENHRNIIYTSAILHDICDKKYVDQHDGVNYIKCFLEKETNLTDNEIEVSINIMETMSYSTVKQNGYPDLGPYQLSYHIVREADLLAAYEFDRSVVYNMNNVDPLFTHSMMNALDLFDNRVFRHNADNLFVTDYSKELSQILEQQSLQRIRSWESILDSVHKKT